MNGNRASRLAASAALCAALFAALPARAEIGNDVTIAVQNAPVVRVQMRSGNLTIRTWNRPLVHITSSDPVRARRVGPDMVDRALRGGVIPIFAASVQAAGDRIVLPPEEFAVTSLSNGAHDGIIVFGGDSGATIALTVPISTAFVWAAVGRGSLHLQNYRSGAFVALVHTGMLMLSDVSGDAYAQVARGPIAIRNSAFNRVRARTALGNILFENCNARQIEVSSVNGSIAYDNGTFVPGLARFESRNGNIALGIAGGDVQIGAHSSSGQIYSDFLHGANVRGSATDAQATLGSGGPIVTASSERGSVYLYDGAFRSRPKLQRRWRPVGDVMRRLRAKTCAKRPCRA